jgi:uroporphyrinogen decarboxylase
MLSSRENVRRLYAKEKADRVGFVDNIWGDTMRKWVTQGYPTRRVRTTVKKKTIEKGVEVEREMEEEKDQPVDVTTHFGFDTCSVGGWFDMLPLRGFSETVEETAEWKVTRNGAGAALKFWKNKSGTPEHVDFRMTSRHVWERDYRPHMLALDRERVNIKGTREALDRRRKEGLWTHFGNLFVFENMRRSLGDLCMYRSVLDDPEWIHDYNRVHTDFYKAHYKLLFDEAGLPDGIWMYEDLGYNKGLFMSPRVLEELFFPYFKEAVDFFHSYGLPVTLHTCGSTREALPMIAAAGFDGLNPMERAAGNDPFEYARKYRDSFVFVGGFDKRILETHDKELIRRETLDYLRRMKHLGARLILASDHSISTNTDYSDFLCFAQAYREEMMY